MPGVMMLSRGLRRVPLDFEHPKRERYDYRTMTMVESFQPVFDEFYVPKVREWLAERDAWQAGERPDWFEERDGKPYTFEEYNDQGPDPDFYYPGEAWPEGVEMGICMYESVTEGTPISRVYPDTSAGRLAMARQIVDEDTSITSAMQVSDWLDVIDGQAGTVIGTEVGTGEPLRAEDLRA